MMQIPSGSRVFGMQLPIQAQSNYFVSDWELAAGPAELAQVAQACDAAGFFYVAVCDHVTLPETVVGGMGTHWQDPIGTLSWLAAQTANVGLLSHVYVLPYRHPLMAAKQFANLDYLSNGRAIVGIGAGHVQAEFEQLGLDFHRRGKAVDEGVPVLAAALESEFVDGFGARPRPVQTPRPPIWIAGSSDAAIKRAGRLADGWLPQGPSSRAMIDLLQATRREHNRADTSMMIGHITPFLYLGAPAWDVGPDTVCGSAQVVSEQILAGTAQSVNQLQVRFRARSCAEICDQITAFGTEVAPLVSTPRAT